MVGWLGGHHGESGTERSRQTTLLAQASLCPSAATRAASHWLLGPKSWGRSGCRRSVPGICQHCPPRRASRLGRSRKGQGGVGSTGPHNGAPPWLQLSLGHGSTLKPRAEGPGHVRGDPVLWRTPGCPTCLATAHEVDTAPNQAQSPRRAQEGGRRERARPGPQGWQQGLELGVAWRGWGQETC